MDPSIEPSWKAKMQNQFNQPYFADLKDFLTEEKKSYTIFPPGSLIFNAFNLTPFDQVNVVILGQDPYHDFGQAHGLCFSVMDGIPFPKSLINIFKELKDDVGFEMPMSGNLEKWAKQGILLLNATLTVRAHQAGSHQNKGWEQFTDQVIRTISDEKEGIVFLLWGNYARAKKVLIDSKKHFILETVHPSPLSAYNGFFGCKHFSKTNEILNQQGKTPINWQL
ncbi:MAG TPA: uracil-DNA glycosylase [Bacteroidales bacterium]|nr:uracil-DNA glycosylase [Bacteroidales bacterium]HPS71404.1 uracil-DNA glycosylase [Bacteroidales bacterium]